MNALWEQTDVHEWNYVGTGFVGRVAWTGQLAFRAWVYPVRTPGQVFIGLLPTATMDFQDEALAMAWVEQVATPDGFLAWDAQSRLETAR